MLIHSHTISQFSHSVVSDSLQHVRPPCPSPTSGVHPNSCPLCWWCHPTISSSVFPFSSCSQSFPASGSFQMRQLSASGGQSIAVAASTSVPPMRPVLCWYQTPKYHKKTYRPISHEYRCKNSQQKANSTTYKKNHTPWQNRIFPNNAKGGLTPSSQWNTLYQ